MWRGMLQLLGAGMILAGACSFSPEGLDIQAGATGDVTATGGTAASPAAMPASAMPSGAGEHTPAAVPTLMRVHDVEVKHLSVGVLFAHKIEAKNGTVASAGPPLPEAELKSQLGGEDIEAPRLEVDVLYAHEVKAHVVSVRELRVADVKIGKDDDSKD